jgi:BBSome-interacting protein 1
MSSRPKMEALLPKAGLVFSEANPLEPVLCKPKIMPIKSASLVKLEKMQKEANSKE